MQQTLVEQSLPGPASPPSETGRWWPRLGWLVFWAAQIWLAWEITYVMLLGNVHAVVPGEFYRGAQPSAESLERIVKKYGIRTVINLRGWGYPDDWHVAEATTCQRMGVHLEDVCFSAMHLPSRHEMRQLIQVIDRAEKPVFFHCRQGADRTGLAAVVTLLLREEIPYAAARKELGLRYGHLCVGRTGHIDDFFDLYEHSLKQAGQVHSPQRFRDWIVNGYGGGVCNARFEKVERLFDVPRMGEALAYRVVVRNTSGFDWQLRPHRTAGIHVAFKVVADGNVFIHEGRAGLVDQVVRAGENIQVTMIVPPIWVKGRFRLWVDMIEEGHCWFHETGSEPWEEELAVRE